jgi:presenilin-like A22 family membrane protease
MKEEQQVRIIASKQVAHIFTIFLSVQFLGLLLLCYLLPYIVNVEASYQNPSDVWVFLIYILLMTFILLIITKKTRKAGLFIDFLDSFVVFFATGLTLDIIISYFFKALSPIAYIISFILAIAKRKFSSLRNILAILSTASVGLLIGLSLDFNSVLILLTALAIYDVVAVFITKHMIELATELSKKQTSFSVSSQQLIPRKEFKEVLVEPTSTKLPVYVSRIELGSGDLVSPLTLAVASFRLKFSLVQPLFIVVFSSIGLLFTIFILIKYKRPLPALPPLFIFSCIGLLLSLLF